MTLNEQFEERINSFYKLSELKQILEQFPEYEFNLNTDSIYLRANSIEEFTEKFNRLSIVFTFKEHIQFSSMGLIITVHRAEGFPFELWLSLPPEEWAVAFPNCQIVTSLRTETQMRFVCEAT